MVPPRPGPCLAVLYLVLASSCATVRGQDPAQDGSNRSSGVGRVVIPVAEMQTPPSLLTILQTRVTSVEIRRTNDCPEIEFRGQSSLYTANPPSIYVDGQHAMNTCILDMLNPHDIDVVEVYPAGVANRPGYFSSMGGLILVFLKNGEDSTEEGDSP